MANDDANEELMTRFLVGDVTPDERDQVERRFMEDPAFFEELNALEEAILTSYARGKLPEAKRRLVEASLAASPARRRRYEELRSFTAAVSDVRRAADGTRSLRVKSWRSGMNAIVWLGSAAVLVTAIWGTWVLRRAADQAPDSIGSQRRTETAAIATFFLRPGSTRTASEAQANVFRIPAGTRTARLTLTLPGQIVSNPRATLAPVGAPPIQAELEARVQPRSGSVDVSVDVPALLVPPGDYLLTISAEAPCRERDTIATRFFSIVR